jgi:hypothetical protein
VLLKSFPGFETIVRFQKLYSLISRAFETGVERRLCTIELDTVFFMQHFSFVSVLENPKDLDYFKEERQTPYHRPVTSVYNSHISSIIFNNRRTVLQTVYKRIS